MERQVDCEALSIRQLREEAAELDRFALMRDEAACVAWIQAHPNRIRLSLLPLVIAQGLDIALLTALRVIWHYELGKDMVPGGGPLICEVARHGNVNTLIELVRACPDCVLVPHRRGGWYAIAEAAAFGRPDSVRALLTVPPLHIVRQSLDMPPPSIPLLHAAVKSHPCCTMLLSIILDHAVDIMSVGWCWSQFLTPWRDRSSLLEAAAASESPDMVRQCLAAMSRLKCGGLSDGCDGTA